MQILLIEDSVTDGSPYISFGCENVNSTLKHLKVTKIQMLLENLTKKKRVALIWFKLMYKSDIICK